MKLGVHEVTREYRGFASMGERLLSSLTLGLYGGSLRYRALDGLSFEAGSEGDGEIVGVIGPNGAGKSTLLHLLSGISMPTRGRIDFRGSIRSILELGVGFNADLNAIQNIFYNGILWGYSPREIREGTEEILRFANLEDFAHQPVSTFSTGMQMRLAFALATHRPADLLLVDEALSVGDASFQQKSVRRFREFRDRGSLILVVSHDIPMLLSLCDRILLLDRGRMIAYDTPSVVSERYMDLIAAGSYQSISSASVLREREFDLRIRDAHGRERDHFFSGEEVALEVLLSPREDLDDVTVGIHINDSRGIRAYGTNTRRLGETGLTIRKGALTRLTFDMTLHAGPGKYGAGLSVHRGFSHATDCYVWEESFRNFEVEAPVGSGFEGMCNLHARLGVATEPLSGE